MIPRRVRHSCAQSSPTPTVCLTSCGPRVRTSRRTIPNGSRRASREECRRRGRGDDGRLCFWRRPEPTGVRRRRSPAHCEGTEGIFSVNLPICSLTIDCSSSVATMLNTEGRSCRGPEKQYRCAARLRDNGFVIVPWASERMTGSCSLVMRMIRLRPSRFIGQADRLFLLGELVAPVSPTVIA